MKKNTLYYYRLQREECRANSDIMHMYCEIVMNKTLFAVENYVDGVRIVDWMIGE